jgi:hypothetical protein
LHIILASGYDRLPGAGALSANGKLVILRKPYDEHSLRKAMQSLAQQD